MDSSSADVRRVWTKVACALGDSWEPAASETLAFAAHSRRSLASGPKPQVFDDKTIEDCAERFSDDDAVAVVGALVDSCRVVAKRQIVRGTGLSANALECLVAVYHAVTDADRRRALRLGVHEVANLMVLLAGRHIAAAAVAAATGPRECLDVASYLVNVVREAVEQNEGGAKCFWILELIFQLCRPGRPGDSLLLQLQAEDDGVGLLLLTAATMCSNIAFATFVASLALQTQYVAAAPTGPSGSRSNDSNAGTKGTRTNRVTPETRSQLAASAPWTVFGKLLDCDLGDGISFITGADSGANEMMAGIHSALSALELSEAADHAGEHAASRLSRYDACFDDGKSTSEYLDSHGPQLFLADRFLGRAVSRATGRLAPVATGMHLRASQTYRQIVAVDSTTTDVQRLAGIEAAFARDCRRVKRMPEVLQTAFAVDRMDAGTATRWWRLYVASRVADAYNTRRGSSAAADLAARSADQGAVAAAVLGMVAASERTAMCFAQVPGASNNTDALAAAGLEGASSAKAKEALLYLGSLSGTLDGALVGAVLHEGSGRVRFTASGTFDAASLLLAQLMSADRGPLPALPLDQPLTARAVAQLSPYVPQLLALLSGSRREQAGAALQLLERLSHAAPDLLVFHAVVAAGSLPAASHGGQMTAALVQQRFDARVVADIRRFLDLAGGLAVLPQERVRWACVKAKSAYDRLAAVVRAGARAGAGALDERRAAGAWDERLRAVRRLLAEYAAPGVPAGAFEAEFIAAVPRLQQLVDRLGSAAAAAGSAPGGSDADAESLWRQVFRLLSTPASLAMSHVSPSLTDFRAAIPIPSLTSPTEPLYFEHTGSTMRVIGSKTRPKMLSLYLADSHGAVRRHRYILKGSEDLRIDECVIQAFVRINRVIRSSGTGESGSSEGAGHGVSELAVYNVVPVDTYGGLIQVVDNAPSLFHLYARHAAPASATARPPEQPSAATGLHQEHARHAHAVLARHGQPRDLPADKWPHPVSLAVYDSLLAGNPAHSTLLHAHLLESAQSAGHMLELVRSSVRSIGVASVAGYVLGLGDRHLDNLLVRRSDGRLVHVDFNVCFDFGSVSHIPEIVPFRLTPVLRFLCGSGRSDDSADGLDAFALSRCFGDAARATLKFARMDRKCLVGAIVQRACFRPFMEWCCIEESRLKKQQQQQQLLEGTDALHQRQEKSPVLGSPHQLPSDRDGSIMHTDDFIRANGLCPPAAFWPRRPVLGSGAAGLSNGSADAVGAVSEFPYGWRIAREAVDRVDARLSYTGTKTAGAPGSHGDKDDDDLVAEQFGILWNAATSKDRLAKMFMGWAPWV
ncbi:hypothetical protein LPJ53_005678 [Coemansia erecta]|uniref:Non-specific serine/threonine protein kinase n=1 Tax=Coemansia erecta TaxID=147472 RepID=A0A9W7XV71_9FUNG|nr:hypothetical protein LPJ53_005678 [Coemansia erecta]